MTVESTEKRFVVPASEIKDFLAELVDLLDPEEKATIEYRGYPHNDYVVLYKTELCDNAIRSYYKQ